MQMKSRVLSRPGMKKCLGSTMRIRWEIIWRRHCWREQRNLGIEREMSVVVSKKWIMKDKEIRFHSFLRVVPSWVFLRYRNSSLVSAWRSLSFKFLILAWEGDHGHDLEPDICFQIPWWTWLRLVHGIFLDLFYINGAHIQKRRAQIRNVSLVL
jgi:hypothetical protein